MRPATLVLAFLLLALPVAAQDPPKFDGVLLTEKEFRQLTDLAEAGKRKDPPKPVAPSECHVRAAVVLRGKPVAVLTVQYAFRTTAPRTPVLFGTQRALPTAAAAPDGKLPLLAAGDDGLTVLAESPGDHALTLTLEAPIAARGPKGEVGFELGLPRAAITTLALDVTATGAKKVNVASRTPDAAGKAADTRRTTDDASRYASAADKPGPPLGAVEAVEVTWDAPAATPAAAESPVSADADVTARVDETSLEIVAKLRLRGPARAWPLVLPAGADVAVERLGAPAPAATVTRPPDAAGTAWTVTTTEPGEWLLTATVRRARPDPKDAKYPGPYPVGPFFAAGLARQAGTVRVFAPVSVQLSAKTPPEVRRQDAPPAAAGDDTPALVFRYAAPPVRDNVPQPLLTLDARPTRGAVVVQPSYKLRLTEAGWRLRADLRVAPVRTDLTELDVALPSGWQTLDVRPPELIDEVRSAGPGRFTVKLAAAKKEPFDLTLEATFPVAPAARAAALPLPRFPKAVERAAQVTLAVPDGFEARGSAREAGFATDLTAANNSLGGTFDAGVTHLDLTWQPRRAELAAAVTADVTLTDRQAAVSQIIKLTAAGPLPRAIRLTGPAAAVGFRSTPNADATAPGEWTIAVPAGAKELTVSLSFAVPAPGVALVWPDAARVETTARVWATGGRRAAGFTGPWRELPPEPVTDRDSLPQLTLAGTGPGLPLAVELAEAAGGAAALVDRAAVQVWLADDGAAQARARFVLRRWPAGGVDIDAPGGAVVAAFVDRKRVENPQLIDGGVRVPLPEPKAGRPGVEVDVRFTPPPGRAIELFPPTIRGAVYRSPVRWQVAAPPGAIALAHGDGFAADLKWAWRGGLFAPGPAATADDLDAWLAAGTDPADAGPDPFAVAAGDDGLTGRQASPGRLRVARVPRSAWVVACSAVAFLVGVLLSRLRPGLLGPVAAALGISAAAAAVIVLQPAAHAAAAAVPGLIALVAFLAGQAALRWYARRRVTHLPAFARGPTVAPSSRSVRPAPGSGTPPLAPSVEGSRP